MIRSQHMTPTRRALSIAGTATVVFSLVLSIAPVLASGNSGTFKIHDSQTDLELPANDPHVCGFYVVFQGPDAPLSGEWRLLSWPPTGDKSVVESGSYDTSGDGEDVTGDLSPAAGHYRIDWDSSNDTKTLWVDDDCVAGDSSPSEEPTPTPTEEESVPSDESSPSEEPTPTPTPTEESVPSDESSPSEEPTASQAPEGDQKDSTHGNDQPSSTPEGDVAPGTGAGPSGQLPDTAVPVTESGVLATIGLLLIIAAHAGTRRERQLPAA